MEKEKVTYHRNENGFFHREDGPAVENENGDKWWWKNGLIHRDGDDPAVEMHDGSKHWFKDGIRHRESGPAIEWADGTKQWWLNGKLHREDGAAVEWSNGDKQWALDGVHLPCKNKIEFEELIKARKEK